MKRVSMQGMWIALMVVSSIAIGADLLYRLFVKSIASERKRNMTGTCMHILTGDIYHYKAANDGEYPESLEKLAAHFEEMGQSRGMLAEYRKEYGRLYKYTRNVRKEDPGRVVIAIARHGWAYRNALCHNGAVIYEGDLPDAMWERLYTEPWALVEETMSEDVANELRCRLMQKADR